jgi:predicted ATP-binding protein involved in virulence
MRLAAIYIDDHEYMFDKPQSISLGGKYLYDFEIDNGNNVVVSRVKNESYIDGFFALTPTKSKVTNLNAIVGQNGAGKTSLLDIIRSEFIENTYALPYSSCLFLAEEDGPDAITVLRNDFNNVFLRDLSGGLDSSAQVKLQVLDRQPSKTVRTIYYSPHYDYKHNSNFDTIDDHDISFDRIVEEDLAELNEKEDNDSGGRYSASQELLFKNSLRQIEFLSSDLVNKRNVFKDLLHLQQHNEPILEIRGYKKNEKVWNTPMGLRQILKDIAEKTETELREWHNVRVFENDKVANQIEINKYIIKRNIIKSILSVLYKQMEKNNTYLQEGFFPYKEFEDALRNANAYDSLMLFIANASLGTRSGKGGNKIFLDSGLNELVNKLYLSIDEVDKENLVENSKLRTSKENAIEILKLQRKFVKALNRYYDLFRREDNEYALQDSNRVEEFVNYRPFEQRFSSGENAMLNLFSRIYNFLSSNLKENKFRILKEHYIILLDEADLAFHPSWKKQYVKALLKTLPYLFDELDTSPSIQIIFTTHDPLTLSDLPNNNVVYIERQSYDIAANVLSHNSDNKPSRTFGANISELLADSFFVGGSLVGDFAYDIIQETIKWLDSPSKEGAERYKKIIQIIDEPIVQAKLAEMYDEKITDNLQAAIIDDQIRKLQELRNKLRR